MGQAAGAAARELGQAAGTAAGELVGSWGCSREAGGRQLGLQQRSWGRHAAGTAAGELGQAAGVAAEKLGAGSWGCSRVVGVAVGAEVATPNQSRTVAVCGYGAKTGVEL